MFSYMCRLPLFLILCLISLGAGAQSLSSRDANETRVTAEQRRAELRLALKSPQELQTQTRRPTDARRQLSVQERADLRQQLREQRREFPTERQ